MAKSDFLWLKQADDVGRVGRLDNLSMALLANEVAQNREHFLQASGMDAVFRFLDQKYPRWVRQIQNCQIRKYQQDTIGNLGCRNELRTPLELEVDAFSI